MPLIDVAVPAPVAAVALGPNGAALREIWKCPPSGDFGVEWFDGEDRLKLHSDFGGGVTIEFLCRRKQVPR